MKLVHVTTLYPRYLADFDRRHPDSGRWSYTEHQAVLYDDGFGWGDYYVRHLRARGHEGTHIVANYRSLQAKWARENGLNHGADDSSLAIVQAQVRAAQPDVLFVEDCHAFPKAKIRALVASAPTIRAVACHHGVEGEIEQLVPREALVLTCAGYLVHDWRRKGFKAALIHHAFEPSLLDHLPPLQPKTPLTFIGNCSPFHHPERHACLRAVAAAVPGLQVWTDSFELSFRELGRSVLTAMTRREFGRIYGHFTSPLRHSARGAVYGLPMYAKLRDSLVTLNRHISQSRSAAGNMRLFEATGAGACLLTDAKDGLEELFLPDGEVVSYSSTDDCVEKVRWLVDHPDAAGEIAQRGQRRTLRDHTFGQRTLQLEELLLEHLQTGGRPLS